MVSFFNVSKFESPQKLICCAHNFVKNILGVIVLGILVLQDLSHAFHIGGTPLCDCNFTSNCKINK